MRLAKSITLVFENCETFKLPINAIGYFHIGAIRQEIDRIACNAIAKSEYADEVAIELYPECEKLCLSRFLGEDKTIFGRIIEYKDITHIEIEYEDGEQYIAVDYDDGGNDYLGAENVNQKVYLSSCGVLYIVIAADKNIADYFSEEYINNEDEINFSKKMYGTVESGGHDID